MPECAFCLVDLADDGTEFCGPPCRASWNLLFADPVDAEPPDDVYDDDRDTLPLTY